MFLVVLLAMIAEVAVLVAVGDWIGFLPTVGLLVLATVLGVSLLRRESARTMTSLREALVTRRAPQREVLDGFLIGAAGVLVVVPGFISDVLAILLLLPPTRALIRRRIVRRAERGRVVDSYAHSYVVVDQPADHADTMNNVISTDRVIPPPR